MVVFDSITSDLGGLVSLVMVILIAKKGINAISEGGSGSSGLGMPGFGGNKGERKSKKKPEEIDIDLSKQEHKELTQEEKELEEAQKLFEADIRGEVKLMQFLQQLGSSALTPEYAKQIAQQRGKAINNTLRGMIKYTNYATNLIKKAESTESKVMQDITKDLRAQSDIYAKEMAKVKGAAGTQAYSRAYNSAIAQAAQVSIAKLKAILNDARNLMTSEKQRVDPTLQQIKGMESTLQMEINALLKSLDEGNVTDAKSYAIQGANNIRNMDVAKQQILNYVKLLEQHIRKEAEMVLNEIKVKRAEFFGMQAEEKTEVPVAPY